jgi:hypothetical protein
MPNPTILVKYLTLYFTQVFNLVFYSSIKKAFFKYADQMTPVLSLLFPPGLHQ